MKYNSKDIKERIMKKEEKLTILVYRKQFLFKK